MSDVEKNVAILQEAYRRYAAEGIDPVLEIVSDDVDWCSIGPADVLPWCGTRTGRDAVARFYRDLNESVEIVKYEAHRMIAQGDWIVVLATATARFKSGGQTKDFDKADVFRMSGGRIVEFREFYDTAKAVTALTGPAAGIAKSPSA